MRALVLITTLPMLGLVVGCGETTEDLNAGNDGGLSSPTPDAGSASDLSTAVDGQTALDGQPALNTLAEDLQFLREEEKLARDVYITLYAKWKINIFNNISKSEQQHTDAVKALIAARGFVDPVTDDTVGVFVNKTLDGLYGSLTSKGALSEVEAIIVGVTIEDLDIEDIEHMKARTSDKEALAVYDNLQCGSRNHLRSFVAQLANRGGTYTPQYISTTTYNQIIQSTAEICGK